MDRALTIRIAAAAAALGSLVTPVVDVVRTATGPVDPVDVADTRARPGAQVTAETVRSNHVVVALVVVSMFAVLAQARLFGLLRTSTFKAQVQEFVSALRMAARASAESDKRYEVIVDLAEQSFILREITSQDLAQVLTE